MLKDVGKITKFSETFEEIEVFAEIFTKFYILSGNSRSKIDFWRHYQQILKKNKRVFHENYQKNL